MAEDDSRAPDGFEEDAPLDLEGVLKLDLEGFEGPIHVLLELARDQKVDILQISMTQLADQYLEFIRQAKLVRRYGDRWKRAVLASAAARAIKKIGLGADLEAVTEVDAYDIVPVYSERIIKVPISP